MGSDKWEKIRRELPKRFTYGAALEAALRAGYSRSWLWQKVDNEVKLGKLERTGRGEYMKSRGRG